MSKEHRETIRETINSVAMHYIEEERDDLGGVDPKLRPEAEAKQKAEHGMILRVANIVAGALCDLDRIADAAETRATPQSEEGRDYWNGFAGNIARIADSLEILATPPPALTREEYVATCVENHTRGLLANAAIQASGAEGRRIAEGGDG